MEIVDLSKQHLNSFYELFCSIIQEDLYEYTMDQRREFSEEMYSKEVIERLIQIGSKKILIILEISEVIGFLFGDKPFGGVGFVSWFGIRKDLRGNGYGRLLMNTYEKYCKQSGAHLIEVYTFPKTVEFYEKIGFNEIGRREKGYFGIVNIIMDKEI